MCLLLVGLIPRLRHQEHSSKTVRRVLFPNSKTNTQSCWTSRALGVGHFMSLYLWAGSIWTSWQDWITHFFCCDLKLAYYKLATARVIPLSQQVFYVLWLSMLELVFQEFAVPLELRTCCCVVSVCLFLAEDGYPCLSFAPFLAAFKYPRHC